MQSHASHYAMQRAPGALSKIDFYLRRKAGEKYFEA